MSRPSDRSRGSRSPQRRPCGLRRATSGAARAALVLLIPVAVAVAPIRAQGVEATRDASIRHLVLLAIAPETAPAKLREIEAALNEILTRARGVLAGEWGRDLSEGARTQGYTHVLLLQFRDENAIEAYRADPAHQALVELTSSHLVKPPLVLDYRREDRASQDQSM